MYRLFHHRNDQVLFHSNLYFPLRYYAFYTDLVCYLMYYPYDSNLFQKYMIILKLYSHLLYFAVSRAFVLIFPLETIFNNYSSVNMNLLCHYYFYFSSNLPNSYFSMILYTNNLYQLKVNPYFYHSRDHITQLFLSNLTE